ncbi:calcium/sodium antiporter [Lipingzhangella sp. LS1_29]|uniref:Calcium/sodium antiporter n=1 Tax=Lipingzhangella rawalii TaxID=2055835 RepID=A0ABU2H2P1_9ACTN|nr:calcium/sodium antiporter [Lipingzhangella rawalii]MDS1269090.1 calcium/sodium antiporter [Lipingzhangella rawalii]
MSWLTILALLAGLGLLIAGGESLVRGASSLARTIGMSALVVGLTVVSFATSAPELAVTTGATLSGYPGLAIGNVVGSNIANILLVLGLCALVVPLQVKSQIIRADIPVMVVLSVAVLLLALDGTLSRTDGALLFAALLAYVTTTVVMARRQGVRIDSDSGTGAAPPSTSRVRRAMVDLLLVILGAVMLVAGARLLVDAASDIATALGVSDLVVGLTVVAIGTSLPELVASLVAVARGERDIAVGNIVGSNAFNIGTVLGLTALISPEGVSVPVSALHFDLPVMLAVAVMLLPLAITGMAVVRWEGALLLACYAAYLAYLVLQATSNDAVEPFSVAMLGFVIPIIGLGLLMHLTHELRRRRQRAAPTPQHR